MTSKAQVGANVAELGYFRKSTQGTRVAGKPGTHLGGDHASTPREETTEEEAATLPDKHRVLPTSSRHYPERLSSTGDRSAPQSVCGWEEKRGADSNESWRAATARADEGEFASAAPAGSSPDGCRVLCLFFSGKMAVQLIQSGMDRGVRITFQTVRKQSKSLSL